MRRSDRRSPLLPRPLTIALLVPLGLMLSGGVVLSQEQEATEGEANWGLASRFTQAKMNKMVFDTSVNPQWIEGTDRFWYTWESSDGKAFWLVDADARTREPLFNHVDMAAQITRLTRDPYDAKHLPIERIEFSDDGNTIQFDVVSSQDEEQEETEGDTQEEQGRRQRRGTKKKVHHFEYDLQTQQLRELDDFEEPDDHPSWAQISPDKQWVVFAREFDLYMMDADNYAEFLAKEKAKEEEGEGEGEDDGDDQDSDEPETDLDPDIEEIRLTTDGEEHYGYGGFRRGMTDDEKAKNRLKRMRASTIYWAPDSSRFALVRSDRREVKDLWVINTLSEPRPTLETYRYDMPGEDNVTQTEIWAFDVAARQGMQLDTDGFPDQSVGIASKRQFPRFDPDEPRAILWLADNNEDVYFTRTSRDLKRIDVAVANATTGDSRTIIEERLNTYVEMQRLDMLDSGDLIWWSERDGWGHYYLYGNDGTLKNQITAGPYSTRRVEGIEGDGSTFYFTANAREEGEDPYYTHLYRVNMDGTGLRLLNPGDFNHTVRLSESNRYFVDNYSRVNTVPRSALMDTDGELVMDLEEADLSLLFEAGYQFPEPFTVKADDSVTDLYGVMYKPFDFDEEREYPIIAYVYPGPQTESVPKAWSASASNTALSQLGFVVIAVGNRGGHPARSKWYHNFGYGNLRDYGLADKKSAIEQLGDRHDFVDVDRVGIYGHSGGGFMSTAAMLVYPDFFDVAVSSSGNHENNVYNRWWSEKHHGVDEVTDDEGEASFEYDIEKNSELAGNLKGHLMLTTGDIDNNVHHAGTFRMANALIRANKRFDFFMFPGQRHGYGDMNSYWFWLRAEYFAKHLIGDERTEADVVELNREVEQSRAAGPRQR